MKTSSDRTHETRGECERVVATTIIAVFAFMSPIVAHAGDPQAALVWLRNRTVPATEYGIGNEIR